MLENPAAAAEFEPRQLVSDLFHELSQPLTSLCCSLELALLQTPSPEGYGRIVSRVLGQAERVSWLTTAMRELFEAAQPGENCEVLGLRGMVNDAVSDLLPVAESAGVQMDCLPGSACPVWFEPRRLRQALFHLLGYLVASGGRGAVVKIDLAEHAAEVVLEVTVSGDRSAASRENSDEQLSRRLGLGIAHAIFAAAGGRFRVRREAEGLGVEVRLRRSPAR